jgi:maleate isomerase
MTLHTARMRLAEATPEDESRMLDDHALPAASDLATARPDVVVFGCTSAGALRGNDYDAELCRRITEVTGVPTISTIASVRAALRETGADRVGVITPYVDELNVKIKASVEADGAEVVRIAGLGIAENVAIADVPPAEIEEFAVKELGGLDIGAAFVSCTNFAGIAALPGIRDRLGVPVVTSNQAVLAAALGALG